MQKAVYDFDKISECLFKDKQLDAIQKANIIKNEINKLLKW